MVDPLSITTGVLALLGTCITAGKAIKDIHDGATIADIRIKSLLSDVESFTQVLTLMKETLEDEIVQSSFQATGHIGVHWTSLSKTIQDGQNTLTQLHTTLDKVNKTVSVFDGSRKHLRYKGAADEIRIFQHQIRSYRDTIQLSMQTVILWNQVTFKESTDQILPNLDELHESIRRLSNLDELHDSIRRIAFEINARIAAFQTLVESSARSETIQTLTNMRDCVQSAASVVSSASTILAPDRGDHGSEVCGSEFGDLFPSEPNEAMLRWVASNTVYEFKEDIENSEAGARIHVEESGPCGDSDHSDSDTDLELEIFQALLRRGKQRLGVEDFDGAERDFRNCLSRVTSPLTGGSAVSLSNRNSRGDILTLLVETYQRQAKWNDALSVIRQKISLASHESSEDALADMLTIADVLLKKQDYAEALLYGRRALKGYRKMGELGAPGVERVLDLLVRICHADGNTDEEEAFAAILSESRDQRTPNDNPKNHKSSSSSRWPPKVSPWSEATASSVLKGRRLPNVGPPEAFHEGFSTEELYQGFLEGGTVTPSQKISINTPVAESSLAETEKSRKEDTSPRSPNESTMAAAGRIQKTSLDGLYEGSQRTYGKRSGDTLVTYPYEDTSTIPTVSFENTSDEIPATESSSRGPTDDTGIPSQGQSGSPRISLANITSSTDAPNIPFYTRKANKPSRRRSRSLSKERIVAQKVIEKVRGEKSEIRRKVAESRKEGDTLGVGIKSPTRSSQSHHEESMNSEGADSIFLSSQISRRPGDQYSFRSGTSKSSVNSPKLLETVEECIRRIIIPELAVSKGEPKMNVERQKDSGDRSPGQEDVGAGLGASTVAALHKHEAHDSPEEPKERRRRSAKSKVRSDSLSKNFQEEEKSSSTFELLPSPRQGFSENRKSMITLSTSPKLANDPPPMPNLKLSGDLPKERDSATKKADNPPLLASRSQAQATYSLPLDGSPITIPTLKGDNGLPRKKSQTSLLIEYFEGGKGAQASDSRRPSVRVKVIPSSKKKSKTGADDNRSITERSKGNRRPSYTKRIQLSPDKFLGGKDDDSVSSYLPITEDSNIPPRGPIEVEIMPRHKGSPHVPTTESGSRYVRGEQSASYLSSKPADSFLDVLDGWTPRLERRRSVEADSQPMKLSEDILNSSKKIKSPTAIDGDLIRKQRNGDQDTSYLYSKPQRESKRRTVQFQREKSSTQNLLRHRHENDTERHEQMEGERKQDYYHQEIRGLSPIQSISGTLGPDDSMRQRVKRWGGERLEAEAWLQESVEARGESFEKRLPEPSMDDFHLPFTTPDRSVSQSVPPFSHRNHSHSLLPPQRGPYDPDSLRFRPPTGPTDINTTEANKPPLPPSPQTRPRFDSRTRQRLPVREKFEVNGEGGVTLRRLTKEEASVLRAKRRTSQPSNSDRPTRNSHGYLSPSAASDDASAKTPRWSEYASVDLEPSYSISSSEDEAKLPSGAARRVMDFFRRRGKGRSEGDKEQPDFRHAKSFSTKQQS